MNMAANIDNTIRGPKEDLDDIVLSVDETMGARVRGLRRFAIVLFVGLVLTVAAANIYAANIDPVGLSGEASEWSPARIWAFVALALTVSIVIVVRSYNTLMLGVMRQAIETMVRSEATMGRMERVVSDVTNCRADGCPHHHRRASD